MKNLIVAILDTMWGGSFRIGRAPRYFKINPKNKSGNRLYKFVGPENHDRLVVVNACQELVSCATQHGKPNPEWLAENLRRLSPAVILVCGKVAQKTYLASKYEAKGPIFYLNHPAARTWTKKQLRATERRVQKTLKGKS